MLMIRPYPAFTIVLPKIWQARSVPVRFVSITRDQSASAVSSVGSLVRDSRRIHQDVDLAEFLEHRIVQRLRATPIQHVAGHAQRPPAQRLNLRCDLLHLLGPRELATTSAPASARPSEIA